MSDRGALSQRFAVVAGLIAALAAGGVRAGQGPLPPPPQGQITPIAVFGTDDRSVSPPPMQPYQEALGLLFNIRSRTVCTAFCVADGMIATAAHCIYRGGGGASPRLADFWFARNYDTVKDYARIAGFNIGAAPQNVLAGSTKLNLSPPIDATRDWALVRLSRPICSKSKFDIVAMSPEEIVKQSQQRKLFQLAYHRDFKQWRVAYSTPCSSARSFDAADWSAIAADFTLPETLVLHTCDTGGASSGSPLLIDTPQGPKAVGINVGTYVHSKVLMRDGKIAQRLKPEPVANTGVASSAFADRFKDFSSARVLMTAAGIRELQRRLAEAGAYAGPIDGTYGPALRAAIETYELRSNRRVTGVASEALLKQLQQDGAGKR